MTKDRQITELQGARIYQDMYAQMILDEQEDTEARRKSLKALNTMFAIERELMKREGG